MNFKINISCFVYVDQLYYITNNLHFSCYCACLVKSVYRYSQLQKCLLLYVLPILFLNFILNPKGRHELDLIEFNRLRKSRSEFDLFTKNWINVLQDWSRINLRLIYKNILSNNLNIEKLKKLTNKNLNIKKLKKLTNKNKYM